MSNVRSRMETSPFEFLKQGEFLDFSSWFFHFHEMENRTKKTGICVIENKTPQN